MQFLVIYQPPQRFADEGLPDHFREVEDQEEVRAQELYAAGSLQQAWALDTAALRGVELVPRSSPAASTTRRKARRTLCRSGSDAMT